MLQVKNGAGVPFKIKSIRKAAEAECAPASVCSIEADDGTGKPPC